MQKQSQKQTASAAWSADSTISTDIERIGLITRLSFLVEVTPSATLQGANQPDGLFRVVQNLRINGSGHTYLNLPAVDEATGGVLWHYMSQLEGFGYGHGHADISAPSETYVPVVFPFHCGTRPYDPWGRDNAYDLTAFIPAFAESQLTAEWTTSGNDVMDDTVTISSAVGRFILDRVVGTEAEILAEMQGQGVSAVLPPGVRGMVPAYTATVHAIDATTTDFDTDTVSVPRGGWIRRVHGVVQDATANRAVRAGDEVTEYSFNSPLSAERIIERNIEYDTLQRVHGSNLSPNSGNSESAGTEQMNEDFDAHYPEGVMGIGLYQHSPVPGDMVTREYGLDMRRAPADGFQIGLLVSNRASGDELQLVWERYQAHTGALSRA